MIARDGLPTGVDEVRPIIELVATQAGIETTEILRLGRHSPCIVAARSVAMYLARELTDASWPQIGRAFRRHHTTALAAHRRVASGPLVERAAAVARAAGIVL